MNTLLHTLKSPNIQKYYRVTYGRNSASLETYFNSLSEEQLAGIEAVSMDMSKSYISATCKKLTDGRDKIVFDRYHRIETLWKSACGFRNKARLRTVILFHLGGLDLYPATH